MSRSRFVLTFGLALVVALPLIWVTWVGNGTATAASPDISVTASTPEAWTPNQTLTYRGTVTRAGKLAKVLLGVPSRAPLGGLRSASGTVTRTSTPGIVAWVPRAPVNLAVGAKLVIPVAGISLPAPRAYALAFNAVDTTGRSMVAGTAALALAATGQPCRQAYPSSYIATENAKPGSPDWRTVARYDPALTMYATRESARCGEQVGLKVHSAKSPWVTVSAYRMGYYGGAGARLIWRTQSPTLGWAQSAATNNVRDRNGRALNMVTAAAWTTTIGVPIDGRFTPGTYLFKADDGQGRQTYAPLTIRDDTGSKHAYLLQQATTTWQAYNDWGGSSFYSTIGAARLSFDRPYDWRGLGSGQYLSLEYGLVFWMEKQGLDVAYWTDLDLHTRARELAARTSTLIVPAHDEYYSPAMRQGLQNGIAAKVNLVSFGANQAYRVIQPDPTGREFLVDERWSSWPDSTTWRHRGKAFHEQAIFGAEYGCRSSGTLTTNDAWLWTGIRRGTRLEGLANGETDWLHPASQAPIPPGLAVLTTAPLDYCMTDDPLKVDIVAYTAPSGARVFGGSTFGWSCFLVQNCPTSWNVDVSAEDAVAVGQAIRNIFAWAESGLVPPPGGGDPAQSLRKGTLRKYVPQQRGKLRPDLGLPQLTIPDDRAHGGLR